jgi:hypothetical protein
MLENKDALFAAILQTASSYAQAARNTQRAAEDPHEAAEAGRLSQVIQATLLADVTVSLHRIALALEKQNENFHADMESALREIDEELDDDDITRTKPDVLS